MANNKKVVQQLQILLETMGYQKVDREIKSVASGMKRVETQSNATATAQNRLKRTQEGVHKTSLAQGKEFSRQAQGLGGLVRAYATVAANVFALSSAFLVLKRAADFDSMMISANSMTKTMGVNVANLAKDLQRATGNNLSFAQSLEVTNKALAAGFNASQFSELGTIVSKISQTFGGSIEANMNKVTQAILRGRTETLSTMGVVIDLEQAYTSYALTLGKTRQELTKFEEQQATLNAFLSEGRKQVGDIQQDPNPYDSLLKTMQDTAQDIMSILSSNVFNPLVGLINSSKEVALALIVVLGAVFARNLTPDMAAYASTAKKSIERANTAILKVQGARADHYRKMESLARTHSSKIQAQARKDVISHMQNELKKKQATVKNQDTIAKYIKTLASSTTGHLKQQTTETVAALKNAEATLTRRINRLKKQGVSDTDPRMAEALAQRQVISIVRGEGTIRNKEAMDKASRSVSTLGSRLRIASTSVRAFTADMAKQAAITRLNTLALIQERGVISGTIAAYRAAVIPIRSVISAKTALITVTRLASTTVALFGVAINSVIPMLAMLWLGWEILQRVMEKFEGSSVKANKKFKEAIKESQERTEEFNNRFGDLEQQILKFEGDRTFHNLAEQIAFVSNALSEASMGVQSVRQAFDNLSKIKTNEGFIVSILEEEVSKRDELDRLKREKEEAYIAWVTDKNKGWISMFKDEWSDAIETVSDEIKQIEQQIDFATRAMGKAFQQTRIRVDQSVKIREVAGLDTTVVERTISTNIEKAARIAGEKGGAALQAAFSAYANNSTREQIEEMVAAGTLDADAVTQVLNVIANSINEVSQQTMAASQAIRTFGDTTLDIRKKLQEGENVFLDKVGLNDEAKMVKQLLNNIKTVQLTGGQAAEALGEMLGGEQGKTIRDYFGIEPTLENLGVLEGRLKSILENYNNIAKNNLQIENQITINKLVQESLALQKKRDLGDAQSVQNAVLSAEAKKEEFELQKRLTENQIALLDVQLANKSISQDQRQYLNLQRSALVEQNKLYKEQSKYINAAFEGKMQELDILKQILDFQQKTLNNQKSLLETQKPFMQNTIELYNWEKKRVELQRIEFSTKETQIRTKLLTIESSIREAERLGNIVDQNSQLWRERNLEEQNLLMLRAEIVEAERKNYRELTEASAKAGNFDDTRKTFALAFVTEYDRFIRNFESAGKRVGDAVITAMDQGIDLIIDNLLTGEANFIESIKGILREGIGGILKDNMKLAGRTIFNEIFKTKTEEPQHPLIPVNTQQLQQLVIQTNLLRLLTQAGGATTEEMTRATAAIMKWEKVPATTSGPLVPNSVLNPNPPAAKVEEGIKTVDVAIQQLEESRLQTEQLKLIAGKASTPTIEETPKFEMAPVSTENARRDFGDLSNDRLRGVLGAAKNTPNTQNSVTTDPNMAHILALAQLQLDQTVQQTGLLANIANTPPPAAAEDVKAMGEDVKVATSEASQSALAGMGSLFSSLLGGLGGDGPAGSFLQTFGSALFSQIPGLAKGGVIKGGINSYANGTITSGPELAVIGEGRRNEAVVPLPNNREIPVQLSGDSGNKVEVNQMFDFKNADPSTERRLRTEANRIKQESFNSVFKEINRGGRYSKAVGRR